MKIIHCGDLHLDSKMTTNLSKEQAKERKMEILRTFSKMVDYAAEHEVRAILIAGDLFDTHNVSATARNMVRDAITTHPEIDFLYLKGNHDDDNFLARLETIPENLKLFRDKWTTYSYGIVTVSGVEIGKENQESIYPSLVLDHDAYNIVTLHGQIGETVRLEELKNKNIDYLALGHLHEYHYSALDARGMWCYSGCLEGRGFDECGKKGFVVLEIDERHRKAQFEFVPFAYRNLYELEVDVTGCMTTLEAAERIEQEVGSASISTGSLVKFRLTGEVDVDSEINSEYLQNMFRDFFYYEKVDDETHLAVNYKDYEKDLSLKGEFVRMVLESDLKEEEKAEVIRCGIQALMGEEI